MRSALCSLALSFSFMQACGAQACNRGAFGIAVDPGHTRASPGAISARGVPEVQYNEVLATRVIDELKHAGFASAFLTNQKQASISLLERTQIANERNARLLLSIHHDSVQPKYLSSWTYRGKRHAYSDVFKGYSLFVSEKNADFAGSQRFAELIGSRLRESCLAPTLHHAEQIPGEARELLNAGLGIYRFDDLVVLKSARMPAVLLEAGLIVNRDEEVLLRSPKYQQKIVAALTGAIVAFCEGAAPQEANETACR